MDKTVIRFGNTEIEKHKFDQNKSSIQINNIDINKVVLSNKVSFGKTGFKNFSDYKDVKKIELYAYFFQK